MQDKLSILTFSPVLNSSSKKYVPKDEKTELSIYITHWQDEVMQDKPKLSPTVTTKHDA